MRVPRLGVTIVSLIIVISGEVYASTCNPSGAEKNESELVLDPQSLDFSVFELTNNDLAFSYKKRYVDNIEEPETESVFLDLFTLRGSGGCLIISADTRSSVGFEFRYESLTGETWKSSIEAPLVSSEDQASSASISGLDTNLVYQVIHRDRYGSTTRTAGYRVEFLDGVASEFELSVDGVPVEKADDPAVVGSMIRSSSDIIDSYSPELAFPRLPKEALVEVLGLDREFVFGGSDSPGILVGNFVLGPPDELPGCCEGAEHAAERAQVTTAAGVTLAGVASGSTAIVVAGVVIAYVKEMSDIGDDESDE